MTSPSAELRVSDDSRGNQTGGVWSSLAGHARRAAAVAVMLFPIMVIAGWTYGKVVVPDPVDYNVFGPAGLAILTGHWGDVFADPILQAGPFEVLPFGVGYGLHVDGVVAWTLFYAAFMYLLTWFVGFAVLVSLGTVSSRWRTWVTFGVCALALFLQFLPISLFYGHPAEIAIPAFWIVAGCLARDRHFALAGAVVALSAGWEVWGILGAPVVLLASNPRTVRASFAAIATLVAVYGPFVATGHFRMFEYRWTISADSLIHRFWPDLASFPWTLRLLQAAAAVAAGVLVAVLTRNTRYGIWLVPLAIMGTRLLLDPLIFGYYWLSPAVLAVASLGALFYFRDWVALTAAAALVALFTLHLVALVPGAILVVVVVLVASVSIAIRERMRRRSFA